MKQILSVMMLISLLCTATLILADSSECRAKCKHEYENCTNRCMVMAADNTHCLKRCEEVAANCMAICGGDGPDDADRPEEWKNSDIDEQERENPNVPDDEWPFGNEDDE